MKKPLAALLILGTGAAMLAPPAVAYAKDGDDDRIESPDDRDGDGHQGRGRGGDDGTSDQGSDDNPTPGSDDGTPDQGSDDNPTPGSDDGTPDQGSGDTPRTNDDNPAGERSRDRDRRRDDRVDVRRSGQCSADSVWRLRVRVKDDRSRIKFQVKTGVAGQSWTYSITDNGDEVAAGTRMTHGVSGDFTVQQRRRSGGAGAHDVTAVAENTTTGETCSGAARG